MSEAQIKQPVVDEPKTPAEPGAEGAGARTDGDELDKLLSEYDGGSRTQPAPAPASPAPATPGTADDLRALTDRVEGLLTQQQKAKFKQDMGSMVKNVRGDINPEFFDDDFMEAWIDKQARLDPRLLQAFANRDDNPRQFSKVVEQLGRAFNKRYSKLPDRQATEDRDAVTAAVRGASTRAPEGKAPDMSKMSPQEFAAAKDALFGG